MPDRPSEAALEQWIEECVASVRDRSDYTVPRVRETDFLLLYGLVARTMRFADAYLKLCRLEYVSEAVALARVALEHAVTAEWVLLMGGGIDRFHRQVLHDRRDHYLRLADWLDNPGLRGEVERIGEPPAGKRLPKAAEMIRDLDEGKFLETSYHVLSQQVHVTHYAVTSFLDAGEEQTHFKYEQDYPYRYQVTYAVAVSTMLVRWILASLTDDSTLLAELDTKSDALILPMNLAENVSAERRRADL
jgi:hypothetical protein